MQTTRISTMAPRTASAATVLLLAIGLCNASSRLDDSPEDMLDNIMFGGNNKDFRSSSDFHGRRVRRSAQFRSSFSKESFFLDEIVQSAFRPERWNGTWVSDTEYAYKNGRGELALFSVVSGQSSSLVPASVLQNPRVFRYWLSPDQQYLLMAINPQKLFRHSFIAVYDVYNIRTGERIKLQPSRATLRAALGPPSQGPGGGPPDDGPPRGPGGPGGSGPPQFPLLYAAWSETGHSLAYVFSNNIFYRQSPESADVVITTTGIPGTVFNGVSDWVYEEEG